MESLVTIYLEMRERSQLWIADCGLRNVSRGQKSQVSDQKFHVEELKRPDWRFNRDMYFKVGERWKWIDKRPWTDEQWQQWSNDSNLRTFAGYCGKKIAGYFELHRSSATNHKSEITCHTSPVTHENDEVEIAYFGLLPEFIGRGLGGLLLTSAIENAWAWEPTPARVWVHTCNRDHPNALANYEARGFKIYKTEKS